MGDLYRERTALITGASSGIGEGFARELAARGMDLILTARSRDRLNELAVELGDEYGGAVEVIPADLAQPGAAQDFAKRVLAAGRQVDMLINNAGFGSAGPFHKQDPARERGEVTLNVMTVVELAHAFVPGMLARGQGAMINVASLAGFQPTPFMSVYGATKAFVLSFSEALWGEYHDKGIRVLALCPGPVETGFIDATGKQDLRDKVPRGVMMQTAEVVTSALKALEKNRSFVIPGAANYLAAQTSRLLPRRLVASTTARVLHP